MVTLDLRIIDFTMILYIFIFFCQETFFVVVKVVRLRIPYSFGNEFHFLILYLCHFFFISQQFFRDRKKDKIFKNYNFVVLDYTYFKE